MYEGEPNPRQTLAVLLGASSFHRAPKLAQGRAFYNSARDFYEYLTGSYGLGLPSENVHWLFDETRSPSDQLQDVRDFLDNRSAKLKGEGLEPQNLIVYYVGHGLFSGPDHLYCLAVRATDERNEGVTSIRVGDLASIIKDSARFLRKFLILDCCFSAAAYKEFQSGPLTLSRVKLLEELPQRGTALLCSASAQDPSFAPEGLSRTMFSDSVLRALRSGHSFLGRRLSLSEIGDLVITNVREAYPESWVRPEVHSPDQREGDIANIPLFPNAAYEAQNAEAEAEATRKAEEEARRKVEEEAEAEATRKAQEEEEAKLKRAAEAEAEAEAEAKRKAKEQREIRRRRALAEAARRTRAEEEAKRAAAKAEKERLRAKEAEEAAAKAEKELEAAETERSRKAAAKNEMIFPRLETKSREIKLPLQTHETAAKAFKESLATKKARAAKKVSNPLFFVFVINFLGFVSGKYMAIAIDKWTLKGYWTILVGFACTVVGVLGAASVQYYADENDLSLLIALISWPGFLIGFRFLNGLSSTEQPSAWYAAAAIAVFLVSLLL
jgi:hypothetical protein